MRKFIPKRGNKRIEEHQTQFGNIKDELFLLSFIILCAGLIFTDAYYQRFGFKYQMLNLSTIHIIYKGLTMIITAPFMLIPYLLTIGLILFEQYAIKNKVKFYMMLRNPIVYLFLIINLVTIYPLAKKVGVKQANIDIYLETTGLPKIRTLIAKTIVIKPPLDNNKYVVFMIDGDFVTIFSPLRKDEMGAHPIMKRIAKSEISIIETFIN